MVSPGQHGIRIFGTTHHAVVAGLALAIAFVLTGGALQAAQAQTYNVIHNFAEGLDGDEPAAGVTLDGAGNLYGTTFEGDYLTGTVFRLRPKGSSWVLSPLFLFTAGWQWRGHSLRESDPWQRRHALRHDRIRRQPAKLPGRLRHRLQPETYTQRLQPRR